jgi:hypothetical protein
VPKQAGKVLKVSMANPCSDNEVVAIPGSVKDSQIEPSGELHCEVDPIIPAGQPHIDYGQIWRI